MCFYCGEPTSFKHCFGECDKIQGEVDLEVFLSRPDNIKTEFEKRRSIYDRTMIESLQADCTGKKLTITLDNIVGDVVLLSRFSNFTSVYKCQCVLTGETLNVDLGKLLQDGKVTLTRGATQEVETV